MRADLTVEAARFASIPDEAGLPFTVKPEWRRKLPAATCALSTAPFHQLEVQLDAPPAEGVSAVPGVPEPSAGDVGSLFNTFSSKAKSLWKSKGRESSRTAIEHGGVSVRLLPGVGVNAAVLTHRERLVSIGWWDGSLKLHDANDTRNVMASSSGGHRGPINVIAISDDGCLLVSG